MASMSGPWHGSPRNPTTVLTKLNHPAFVLSPSLEHMQAKGEPTLRNSILILRRVKTGTKGRFRSNTFQH